MQPSLLHSDEWKALRFTHIDMNTRLHPNRYSQTSSLEHRSHGVRPMCHKCSPELWCHQCICGASTNKQGDDDCGCEPPHNHGACILLWTVRLVFVAISVGLAIVSIPKTPFGAAIAKDCFVTVQRQWLYPNAEAVPVSRQREHR